MNGEKSPHVVVTNSRDYVIAFVLMFIFFASVSLYGAYRHGVMKEKVTENARKLKNIEDYERIKEKIEWVEQNIIDQMGRDNAKR